MAFDKKNWLDRECEYPNRRLLHPTDGGAARSYTVERDEGLVYEDGDRFDAPTMNDLEARVEAADAAAAKALAAHTGSKSNPHAVTKAQVGLANVDNIQQATKAEFTGHTGNRSNPHGVTKAQVSLGNVDNVQQATKTEFNSHTGNRSNPHAVTKAQVGLGNVDNAQQATKTEFNSHKNSTSNPHGVTAAQARALGLGGGTLTGQLRVGYDGIKWTTTNNSLHAFMGDGPAGRERFDFRCTGNGFLFRSSDGNTFLPVYASNVATPSAARYKQDFTPYTRAEAERLLHLPVYRYHYKKDSGFDDGRPHAGLVAEDMAQVDKSLVYNGPGGELEGINYPALVPVLLRLLQAQGEDIAALRENGKALCVRINALEHALAAPRGDKPPSGAQGESGAQGQGGAQGKKCAGTAQEGGHSDG